MDTFNFVISVDKDTLDFWASVIGSLLSWPVAFLIAVWAFRKQLGGLIDRIRKFKIPGAEVDTAEQLLKADLSASDARSDDTSGVGDTSAVEAVAVDEPGTELSRGQGSVSDGANPDVQKGSEQASVTARTYLRAKHQAEALTRHQLRGGWMNELEDALDESGLTPKVLMLEAWNELNIAIETLWTKVSEPDAKAGPMTRVLTLFRHDLIDQSFFDAYLRLHTIRSEVMGKGADFSVTEAQAFSKIAGRLQRLVEHTTTRIDGAARTQTK